MKLLILLFLILKVSISFGQKNEWIGTYSKNWNNKNNWTLNRIPNKSDTVIIRNEDSLVIRNNLYLKHLECTQSNIYLNNHSLTLSEALSLNEAKVSTGRIKTDSICSVYLKRNLIESSIDISLYTIYAFQNTFRDSCRFNFYNTKFISIKGGNSFESNVTWNHLGDTLVRIDQYEGSKYQAKTFINLHHNGDLELSYSDTSIFSDSLIIDNKSSRNVKFGVNSGKTIFNLQGGIYIKSFEEGKLSFKETTFLSPVNVSLDTNSKLEISDNCVFHSLAELSAPNLKLKSSTFKSITKLTKHGSSNDYSFGGNLFEKQTTIINHGAGDLLLATHEGDHFLDHVNLINTGSGILRIAQSGINIFENNINIVSNKLIRFANQDGEVHFSGDEINITSNQKTYFGNLDLTELNSLVSTSELILEGITEIHDCQVNMNGKRLHIRNNNIQSSNGGFFNWNRLIIKGEFNSLSLPYRFSDSFKNLTISSDQNLSKEIEFQLNHFSEDGLPRLHDVRMNPYDQFEKDSLICPLIFSCYNDLPEEINVSIDLENTFTKYLTSPASHKYDFDTQNWIGNTIGFEFSINNSSVSFKAKTGKNHFILNNNLSLLSTDDILFNGSKKDNHILLKWSTTTNSHHFTLEKYLDEQWISIYQSDFSDKLIPEHEFNDSNVLSTNIYRLKSINMFNQTETTDLLTITGNEILTPVIRYFNLQGKEITKPTKNGVYILEQSNGNYSKILIHLH